MSERIRAHIRSNVVGYIAVFIALGGTASAVNGPLAGKNTVGSSDIINNEVRSKDIGSGQVGSDEVVDNALTTSDIDESTLFNDNSLTGDDLAANLTLENVDSFLNLSPNVVRVNGYTGMPPFSGPPDNYAQIEATGVLSTWSCAASVCTQNGALDKNGIFGQRLELKTINAPSTPNAGRAYLYVTDTGDGRQRLQVKFADGDTDELAIDAP